MSIEAMKQARSVISSINSGRQHEIKKNGETVFWQREEWVRWGLDEVLPLIDQAIAEAEKQEPDKYVMDIECTKCGAQQSGILTVNTTSQQRKPLTDDEIAEVAERMEASDPTDSFWRDFARAIEAAHGIKGEV